MWCGWGKNENGRFGSAVFYIQENLPMENRTIIAYGKIGDLSINENSPRASGADREFK
jgi:hypothetical protein